MISSAYINSTHQSGIISFINTKQAAAICCFIAFLNKLTVAWLYTDLEADKSLYLLLSQSILNGHFLLEPVDFAGMGHTSYIFNRASYSPVYSLLATPFLWLTGSYFTTSLLVDAVGWAIFISGLYNIAQAVFKHRWISSFFILCAGFFLYPHELSSTPKDTLAMGFIFWSLYYTYKIIGSQQFKLSLTLFAFAFYLALALTKYLYAPLLLLFPALVFIYALKHKDKKLLYYGCYISFFILVSIIAVRLIISEMQHNGDNFRLPSDGTAFIKGFFPGNLLHVFPFICSSLINTNFAGVQMEKVLQVPFENLITFFQWLDILVLGAGLLFLSKHKTSIKRLSPLSFFILATAATIVFMVCYMSLTHESFSYKSAPGSFTYVKESRSFLFPIISIQLFFFYAIFRNPSFPKKFGILLLLLFSMECLHGLYFTVKQVLNAKEVIAYKKQDSPNKQLIQSLLAKKANGHNLSLLTTDVHLRRLAKTHNLEALSFTRTCERPIQLTKPALIVVHKSDSLLLNSCFPKFNSAPEDSASHLIMKYYEGH